MDRADRISAGLHSLSLRQLRCFVSVAQYGSFSRAASELSVSQPALSATIRQLEQRLELTLFDRTTHRVALSDHGRAVLPHAERLLMTADHAFADMRAAVARRRVSVRIGVMPSATTMVAQAIAAIDAGDDAAAVHIADGRSDELLDGLRAGRFDLIVGVPSGPVDDLEAATLVEDDMLLVVAASHPLAQAGRQPWRALTGCEIVHFNGGSIGELAAAALTAHGLAASARFRVDQVESLYGLVCSGLAIGIMPRLYTHSLGHSAAVRLVRLIEPEITRKVMLMHRRQLHDEHPAAVTLARRLAAVLPAGPPCARVA